MKPTRRDLLVSLLTAAIVLGATYYGGPLGGKAAREVVVPRIERSLHPSAERAAPERPPRVAGRPVMLGPPERLWVDKGDTAYYRALLREGVFPVMTHEARP